MPYCPKCEMEFIKGITVCSDCKGPLVESKEAAEDDSDADKTQENTKSSSYTGNRVYVRKSEQYEDLKSSASAFLLIGGILLVVSLLCWTGIIQLPVANVSRMMSQSVLTLMGVSALAVAFWSTRSARSVESQVHAEEAATGALTEWFLNNHDAGTLDYQLTEEGGFSDLSPEEQSLKRFDLIQDIFIVNYDLQNQAYVDLLVEEIYSKLFE